ncbi:MAG TPA: hypothetical protein VEU52_10960 [Candidatus Limnocylindrales bacterium]|jgi:hypothetical protein|nr:hypothetical protein [Candidatus Limnocylindrales bacterium]
MNAMDALTPKLERNQRTALIVGIVSLAVCAVYAGGHREQFFHSYLLAYVFWIAIPLGAMAILMLHHLTGGWWGYPIRRLLEAATRTFALMALLFVPVLLGMSRLYEWVAHPGELASNPDYKFKALYLTPKFFVARTVIYFAIWLTVAWALNKWSSEQDRTGDPRLAERMENISGPGLILWGLAVTYSSVDWVMSLEPRWFSTIYGMIFMVVEALIAMSFVVYVLSKLADQEPIASAVAPQQFNDLGNLMLAFVMLWAYLGFSQFLLIWAGNIKDEIPWYMSRAFGGWGAIAAVLIVLHFAVPFLLLLQRGLKRRLGTLSFVAGFLIVLTLVDVYWMVAPAYEKEPKVFISDVFALLGIGGLWIAAFLWQVKKMPLLPLKDPRFEGALQHGD